MPAGLMASAPPTRIPAEPDLARMQRERVLRIHAAMSEQGIDALLLLGNTNVAYATGAIWPLADSGRMYFERPVAAIVADDEWPHLFSPVRAEEGIDVGLPADHTHGPVYLDFDEGVGLFADQLAGIVPAAGVLAMRRGPALGRGSDAVLRRGSPRRWASDQPSQGGQDAGRTGMHA